MGRKKQQAWDHHVDGRQRGAGAPCIQLAFGDAEIARDTAMRLRNLGLVVMEHSRPAPAEPTRLWARR